MTKRQLECGVFSTNEIKKWRMTEQKLGWSGTVTKKEENLMSEIDRMSAKDVQDYLIITSNSLEMVQARILELKTLQKIDIGYYHLIQIHGYIKFNDQRQLKALLKECLIKHGSSFINRIVKYAAQFCYNESELLPVMQWSNMMTERKEYDWTKAFNNAILASPDNELQLNSTMIMLIPNPAPKIANRVFTSLAKLETLPPCFELLAKRTFQFVTSVAFHKSDMEPIARKYLFGVYQSMLKWKAENKKKPNVAELAQAEFLSKTLGIANKAFGIIRAGDEAVAQSVLDNPSFKVVNPTELFIEYFIQYVTIGAFAFNKGDKLIAWNYYYDDRWCGYDRMDLFGDKPNITQAFKWCSDFKHAGKISQHSHHASLIFGSKVYEWMSADPEILARLLEKYDNEDLIQHLALSLSFAGSFKQTLGLFEKCKTKMKTKNGFVCLHLCYMYSCAREGMASECLLAWANVMESAIQNNFLDILKFSPNTFPLPQFVETKYAAQFACRLLRNCLWTACIRDGTVAWKKYGFILVHLCDALEESFLNHNMLRILFEKISLEDMPIIVKPGLEKCIRHHYSFWDCLNVVKARNYQIPENVFKKKVFPMAGKEYPTKPRFLLIYKKLRRLNEIFYDVMPDLPKILFDKVKEEKLKSIEKLSSEKQAMIREIIFYHQDRARKEIATNHNSEANGQVVKNNGVDGSKSLSSSIVTPLPKVTTYQFNNDRENRTIAQEEMEPSSLVTAETFYETTPIITPAEIKQELAETEEYGGNNKDDNKVMPILEKEVNEPAVHASTSNKPVANIQSGNKLIATNLSQNESVSAEPISTENDMSTKTPQSPQFELQSGKEGMKSMNNEAVDSIAPASKKVNPNDPPVQVLEREKEGDAGEQLPIDAHFVEADDLTEPVEKIITDPIVNEETMEENGKDTAVKDEVSNAPAVDEVKPENAPTETRNEESGQRELENRNNISGSG